MSDQLLNHGDTLEFNGQTFEVTAVSNEETPAGEKHRFAYTVRLKADVDADRQAAAEAEAKVKADQEAAEQAANQPTEGTQDGN